MVDANVPISAALRPSGAIAERVRRWGESRRLVLSPFLLAEVERVLRRPKWARYGGADRLANVISVFAASALLLDPPSLPASVCRDPDDDHVLALALHARAGWIVTGDRDLLVLDPWEGIRIVAPGDADPGAGGVSP